MTLADLEENVAITRKMVEKILHATQKQWLSLQEVCDQYLGRSVEWARTRPWALPPHTGDRPYRFNRAVADEFYSRPLDERKDEYFRARRET